MQVKQVIAQPSVSSSETLDTNKFTKESRHNGTRLITELHIIFIIAVIVTIINIIVELTIVRKLFY